jgi:hypothetical protein
VPKVLKLSGKITVTGQNSGELYTKKYRIIFLLCFYYNKYFEKYKERLFGISYAKY